MTEAELELKVLDLDEAWHDAMSGESLAWSYGRVDWIAYSLGMSYDEAHVRLYGRPRENA
jgi:hypothetical protein